MSEDILTVSDPSGNPPDEGTGQDVVMVGMADLDAGLWWVWIMYDCLTMVIQFHYIWCLNMQLVPFMDDWCVFISIGNFIYISFMYEWYTNSGQLQILVKLRWCTSVVLLYDDCYVWVSYSLNTIIVQVLLKWILYDCHMILIQYSYDLLQIVPMWEYHCVPIRCFRLMSRSIV